MARSLARALALAAAVVAPGASGLHGASWVHRRPAATTTTTPAFVNGACPAQLCRKRVSRSLPVMTAVDPNHMMDVITQVAVAAKAVGTDIELYVPPNPFQVLRAAPRPTNFRRHSRLWHAAIHDHDTRP